MLTLTATSAADAPSPAGGAIDFTRVRAEHLRASHPRIPTVGISTDAREICRTITGGYAGIVTLHHARSKVG